MKSKLLILGADERECQKLQEELRSEYVASFVLNREAAVALFRDVRPPVVLLDTPFELPSHSANEESNVLSELFSIEPLTKVVTITDEGDRLFEDSSIGRKIFDFVKRPVSVQQLKSILTRAYAARSLEEENRQLQQLLTNNALEGMIGTTPVMQSVFEVITKVAPTEEPVLLLGETGTGKDMAARAIHQRSIRKNNAFVTANCRAIPEQLLEGDLFGYGGGARRKALRRKGLCDIANHGTLFLDGIDETSPAIQAKLLRFFQERSFIRVNGRQEISVNCRVIAAAGADLCAAMAWNGFRQDLFHRLSVVELTLPPLRERREDIPILAQYFLLNYSGQLRKHGLSLGTDVVTALNRESWPGNVRQLGNCIRRATIMAEGDNLNASALNLSRVALPEITPARDVRKVRREEIEEALRKHNGNVTQAAAQMGVSRPTLYSWIEKHGLLKKATNQGESR